MVLYNFPVKKWIDETLKKSIKDTTEREKRIFAYCLFNNYENSYIRMQDIITDMEVKGWFSIPFSRIQSKLLSKGGLLD